MPLAFGPDEAFQFDWSEDWAIIGNERTKLQVAHTKLSDSRAFIVRAYLPQTHEMLFDAHNHAFRVFGGIPGAASTTVRRRSRAERDGDRQGRARQGALGTPSRDARITCRHRMVDILALVLQHGEEVVLSAVEMALQANVPTKTHVLNLLHRLVDGKSFTPPDHQRTSGADTYQ